MFDFWKRRTARNQAVINSRAWKQDPLLQDCFRALRGCFTVAVPDQREAVEAVAAIARTEDSWTAVDTVPPEFLTGDCFVLWDREGLPVLHCAAAPALQQLGALSAAARDTFLVSEGLDRIVHVGMQNQIRLYSVT